jgi:hypothetical protein
VTLAGIVAGLVLAVLVSVSIGVAWWTGRRRGVADVREADATYRAHLATVDAESEAQREREVWRAQTAPISDAKIDAEIARLNAQAAARRGPPS